MHDYLAPPRCKPQVTQYYPGVWQIYYVDIEGDEHASYVCPHDDRTFIETWQIAVKLAYNHVRKAKNAG